MAVVSAHVRFEQGGFGMTGTEEHYSRNMRAAISGATGGLGKAFAVECASRGWDLFLTDLSKEALDLLAGGLRSSYGVKVQTYPCDLTDAYSRTELFEALRRDPMYISMLINVAGTDYEGPFFEQNSEHIRTIIRLNIEGTLVMTSELLRYRDPLMAFRIINVASLAAFFPMPAKATYAASKRFLLDFSLALREEVRSMGATVTVLCPAGMPSNPDVTRAIESHGLMGLITTVNTGRAANEAINAALAGKPVVIPGLVNRMLPILAGMIPPGLVVRIIGRQFGLKKHEARNAIAASLAGLSQEY
jgi:short-subunit dehydrogenase